jgi:hypothetical protein
MKVTMIAPKMRTISDDRAFERITSSMWGKLLLHGGHHSMVSPQMSAKPLYGQPLESLTP